MCCSGIYKTYPWPFSDLILRQPQEVWCGLPPQATLLLEGPPESRLAWPLTFTPALGPVLELTQSRMN